MSEKIVKILNTYAGEDIDLCYTVLETIKKDVNPENGLQTFFENIRGNKTDSSYVLEKNFQMEQLQQWDKLYSRYINEFLLAMVSKAHMDGWNKQRFYSSLWNGINNDLIFENDKVKTFVIFKCAQNVLMPFFVFIQPLKMENERFIEILNRNQESIQKIQHILAMNFTQKTEVSSLILNELLDKKTFEDQSVILAITLDNFVQSKMNMFAQAISTGGVQLEQMKRQ